MNENNITKYAEFNTSDSEGIIKTMYSTKLSLAIVNYLLMNDDKETTYADLEVIFCDIKSDRIELNEALQNISKEPYGPVKIKGTYENIRNNTMEYYISKEAMEVIKRIYK